MDKEKKSNVRFQPKGWFRLQRHLFFKLQGLDKFIVTFIVFFLNFLVWYLLLMLQYIEWGYLNNLPCHFYNPNNNLIFFVKIMFIIIFYDNIIFNFYSQSGVLFQTHRIFKVCSCHWKQKKGCFHKCKTFFLSFLCNHENVVEFGVSFCHKFYVWSKSSS